MNNFNRWLAKHGCLVRCATSNTKRQRIWFTRNRSPKGSNYRLYHIISLGRVISSRNGTAMQLIIGPLNLMWGYRENKVDK